MTIKQTAFAVAAVVLLGGCTTPDFSPYSSATYPPRQPEDVQVYQSKMPTREYDEIGMIEIEGAPVESASDLMRKVRAKAAEIGADAIILQQNTQEMGGLVPVGGMLVASRRKVVSAVAIKYKDEKAAAAPE